MDLQQFPHKPGIYQMRNAEGDILYVGKARDLRKRLASYFRDNGLSVKTQALMRQVERIDTIITASDTEALLLEANLIKQYSPRYNVLLRDDKSYPYLYLSTEQDFPRLDGHRGARKQPGRYFGPYPSMGSVRENLALLQKLFQIRSCRDSFFRHRSRPCLQYQIKRCTAPCVGYVSEAAYRQQVDEAILFLEGRSDQVIKALSHRMDEAATNKAYELAAQYRDRMMQLRRLQETQCVSGKTGDVDIVAVALEHGAVAVNVVFVRQGRLIGQRLFFPRVGVDETVEAILSAFLVQYYLNTQRQKDAIDKVILSDKLADKQALESLLAEQWGRSITVTDFRGALYKQWQTLAKTNAQHGLRNHLHEKASAQHQLLALQDALHLEMPIERIECFDISHTMGEATVASCVVFDATGANHGAYRRFNIKAVTAGDDYAAMRQALMRRYAKLKENEAKMPDIVLIDGGKGQLQCAIEVMESLQINDVLLLGVSKGPARKPGQEQLWLPGHERPTRFAADSEALHLIQFIRDEAHRFAITTHRKQRQGARTHSSLEDIPGVGAARRRELLRHFGGMQALKDASAVDIAKVNGISQQLAQVIYDHLHG